MIKELRLNSVVPDGVGGPEAGAINLIYLFLFREHKLNAYRYISINQIGDDLNEMILKNGKQIHVNLRYPAPGNWKMMSHEERNRIRLEVLHLGLLRIADKEKRMDINVLDTIKNTILKNNFSFDFTCYTFANKKNQNLTARLIVHPGETSFQYYVQIEALGEIKCRPLIYTGFTTTFYVRDLFCIGKWKESNKFVLTGKRYELEIHINIDSCNMEYVNLTPYEKAPYFEMFRSDISPEERAKASQDWQHSLPPEIAAAIRDANN